MRTSSKLTTCLILSAFLLTGCVSDLDHSSITRAGLGSNSPKTISGPTLNECINDQPIKSFLTSEATFDPEATEYQARYAFYRGGGFDVSSLRAYTIPYASTTILGEKRTNKMLCFYDARNGKLVYLTYLLVSEDDTTDRGMAEYQGRRIYTKMLDAGRIVRVGNKAKP